MEGSITKATRGARNRTNEAGVEIWDVAPRRYDVAVFDIDVEVEIPIMPSAQTWRFQSSTKRTARCSNVMLHEVDSRDATRALPDPRLQGCFAARCV